MSDELKACPFCGSSTTTDIGVRGSVGYGHGWQVWCNECGNGQSGWYAHKEYAAESWNTRPIEAELLAALQEMERSCRRCEQGSDSGCQTECTECGTWTRAKAAIAKHGEKP